jgi:phenylacetate-CoA ligase
MISPSVLTHPFKPLHGIDASQIIQEDYEHFIIKLIPNTLFKEKDKEHLIREFHSRLGNDVDIEIKLVDDLNRANSGKFKWVISKVDKGIHVPD